MTDATSLVWVAVIGAVPTTLTVLITARMQSRKVERIADIASGKESESTRKLEVIHLLVNSRLAEEVQGRQQAEVRIRELEEKITELSEGKK